jgi:uncharacterized phage-like protein YoqJ
MAVVCFTGHRPDKLPGGYNYYSKENIELGKRIRAVCEKFILEKGVDTFICGGALGVDQISFMVVNKLKQKYPNIKLILALPLDNLSKKWSEESKLLLEQHRKLADKVVIVDTIKEYQIKDVPENVYHVAKMQKRNEYMVDHTDYVVAVYNNDQSGGTFNCIKYAKSKNKEIEYIAA